MEKNGLSKEEMKFDFWNRKSLMERLDCSRSSLYRYLKQGLPNRKLGSKMWFIPKEVYDWIESQKN
jgi:predicted DNA-binding transcriptional regulator AlpA|tara:strand:+ start:323 stop:520 length:198 start_codon:yes stop_codon:yes gene_type:complete